MHSWTEQHDIAQPRCLTTVTYQHLYALYLTVDLPAKGSVPPTNAMARPPQDIPTNADTDGKGGKVSTPAPQPTMGGLPALSGYGLCLSGAYHGPTEVLGFSSSLVALPRQTFT